MPVTTQPNVIELSDFTGGIFLDVEEAGIPTTGLAESMNNLIDVATGSIHSRKGFSRLFANTGQIGYRIYSLHPHTNKQGDLFLIAVLSNGLASSDNIMVYSLRLANPSGTWTKVSPTKTWNSGNGRHFGVTVDGIFYGGGDQDDMYSYEPGHTLTGAWSSGTAYTVGDEVTLSGAAYVAVKAHTNKTPASNRPAYWRSVWRSHPGVPIFYAFGGTDRPADYAFPNGASITYTYTRNGNTLTEDFLFVYDPPDKDKADGWRYPTWQSAHEYNRGDKVSVRTSTSPSIWKTFRCIKHHGDDSGGDNHQPPNNTYWTKLVVPEPVDEDGRLHAKFWDKIPSAPKTRVALWHGNRLFARNDPTHSQVLLYSAQAKVGEREVGLGLDRDNTDSDRIGETGDPAWDAADWRVRGAVGGGSQPFETKEGDEITGLASLGYYLIVFKRYHTFVIAGLNPDSWTVRELAPVGATYASALCEHEGQIYFMSDRGFFQTDGTQVVPVPGSEKIEQWLRQHVDWAGDPNDVNMFSHDGFVWLSLPAEGQIAAESGATNKDPTTVLVYDAVTQSFWPQSISMQAVCKQRYKGTDHLFFSQPTSINNTDYAYDWGALTTGGVWTTDNTDTIEARWKRQSRRSVGGSAPFVYNLIKNPSYEADSEWGQPVKWNKTTVDKVKAQSTKQASRSGSRAVHISNLRTPGSTGGSYAGYEGIYQSLGEASTNTHIFQVDYRRANWRDDRSRVPNIRFLIGATSYAPTDSRQLGNGWFRFWKLYTGSTTARDHGIMVPAGADGHADCAIVKDSATGPVNYFSGLGQEGDGSTGVLTGNKPQIMEYGTGYTDDRGTLEDGVPKIYPIRSFIRTAWLAFGVLKEERRIRRTWALIRGNVMSGAVRTFLNYRQLSAIENTTTVPDDVRASVHLENYVPDDAYSTQLHVELTADRETAILGVALDTEPRRIRYWNP